VTGAEFRVGVTRDFLTPDGRLGFGDIGLGLLEEVPGVTWSFLSEDVTELRPTDVAGFDALFVLGPRVTPATLAGNDRLTLVARFGVGYDTVDVPACTEHGVLLTISPDGVRRPMAVATLTAMLALSHRLVVKDGLTRAGRWHDRLDWMGTGLTGRTLGVIGLGNIAREFLRLVAPLEMNTLAYDPYTTEEQAELAGAELVALDELLTRSDVVSVHCALTEETRHLLDATRLATMGPGSLLLNLSRGPIVDERALVHALREGVIAGAALDVFEQEPIDPSNELLTMDEVIVTPHALGWTDELAWGNGSSACRSILEVAAGRIPQHLVNPEAAEHPQLVARLRHHADRRDR
jgi:phosphoglycerate dehydrogenase-like enzyme